MNFIYRINPLAVLLFLLSASIPVLGQDPFTDNIFAGDLEEMLLGDYLAFGEPNHVALCLLGADEFGGQKPPAIDAEPTIDIIGSSEAGKKRGVDELYSEPTDKINVDEEEVNALRSEKESIDTRPTKRHGDGARGQIFAAPPPLELNVPGFHIDELNSNGVVGGTGGGHFPCATCGAIFFYRSALSSHRQTHEEKEKHHRCSECGKEFLNKSRLNARVRSHTGKKIYQYSKCNMQFSYPSLFNAHKRIHIDTRSFVCAVCKRGFRLKSHLTSHMLALHCGNFIHECKNCRQGFRQKSRLIEHQKIHTHTHVCDTCGKRYKHLSGLNKHVMRVHGDSASTEN